MGQLGKEVAQGLLQNVAGKSKQARIEELVKNMQGLGYEAEALPLSEHNQLQLQAHNCVYHDLAQEYNEVCEFDLALMSTLLDSDIEHLEF